MTELIVGLLRFVHVFAGVIWVGWGLFMLALVRPTAQNTIEQSQQRIYQVMSYRMINRMFPITAGLTMLAGIILYIMVWLFPGGQFSDVALRNAGGIVLTIGAIAGIIAGIHGGQMGKLSEQYFQMISQAQTDPTDQQVQELQAMHGRVTTHAMISAGLLIIAVLCMSTFQVF